ncbi:TlpA family protein disulfide reductase [Amycolatopsis sp. A133]|uniref:TlpA family protein disulfide reductase n=1 Tax=Amycolatopsis sp. A133 TaxID=3064472 RepID=UPI0027F8EE0D|nr:TlpA family protein disulfide reductase [Amycolatopsis sp. A133]MDQ7807210.1 TlpA family protein disulfide reductase [Amycolatopsis sp. A133]
MPLVVATLVLLGLFCLLNLLLTIGILRRMRAQTVTPPPFALRPGSAVGEFAATTTDGEPLTTATLTGTVAFFSADCAACHDTLPDFLAYAREQGRDNVFAVFGGDEPDTVRALAEVAHVVTAELDGGPVAAAFRNTWTPALYVVADGRVVATAGRVHELPVPAGR